MGLFSKTTGIKIAWIAFQCWIIVNLLLWESTKGIMECPAVWGLVISAVIGAASAYSESSQKKKGAEKEVQNRIDAVNAQDKARQKAIKSALGGNFLGQYGLDDIFGTKPEGIDPPSVDESLGKNVAQIKGQGLPAALDFTSQINQQFSDETLALNLERINRLMPNFGTVTGQIGNVTEDLAFGRLPFDDVMDIVSDRQSLSGALGTPGGSTVTSFKDLGLSRMSAMQQGADMFSQFANTLQNAISPTPRFARGDELLPYTSLTANQRVQGELDTTAAMQQAELINAMADPAAAALFGEEFMFQQQAAGMRAGTAVNTGSPWAAAGQSAANSYASYLQQDALNRQAENRAAERYASYGTAGGGSGTNTVNTGQSVPGGYGI